MSQNTVIVLLILVVLGLAGVWFVRSSSPQASPTASTESTTNQEPSTVKAGATPSKSGANQVVPKNSNTFGTIFSQPGSHECIYEQVGADERSRNIVFIADGRMRGEFRTVTGPNIGAHLLVYDGTYLYTWTEGKTTGTKTKLTSISQLPKALPRDLTSDSIYGTSLESVGWDCHTWLKDVNLLVPPSYVTFTVAS